MSLCPGLRFAGVKVKFRASSTIWFQQVWGPHACSQQFSSASCKNNLGMCVRPLSVSFRELAVWWFCQVVVLQSCFCSLETMYIHQWNRDNLLLLWVSGYCLRRPSLQVLCFTGPVKPTNSRPFPGPFPKRLYSCLPVSSPFFREFFQRNILLFKPPTVSLNYHFPQYFVIILFAGPKI